MCIMNVNIMCMYVCMAVHVSMCVCICACAWAALIPSSCHDQLHKAQSKQQVKESQKTKTTVKKAGEG